ncbi:helix-turn-helix domain-containing protein [Paraburkholderia edwinii]|jgi:transcriptional regulator with XRE-family HTH domain|uniref:Helix-turn-helix domain-containing protein n=1 Tax=Paraburkholderia edwinii TaxID=2861782 RepID=A0ABX8UQK9_9BURK|nr:helix-turn-helix transcriptional regulator [Paraburkholderia edwinii]QYD71286.1 helix-turn-helix domain-containing protein [Paraburkholderia edwinii]
MARTLPRPTSNADPLASNLADVGAIVRNWRAENGMPINDAADLLGVSKDVISRLENGRPIGLDKLFLILDGFGLNMLIVSKRNASIAREAVLESAAQSPDVSAEGAQ